ncbi:MAG: Spy/CpxP family protein refolding chaperone [Burkholderiaceae bacterium]
MDKKHALMALVASVFLSGAAMAQPHGSGPGTMGGYGMGSGMMGGYGMGPGMMGGYGNEAYAGLKFSAEQQKKITAIRQETSKAMWQQMGTMHEQGYHMNGMFGPGPLDEAAARKAFQTMQETQKTMFDMQLEAHKKIDATLTQEQRDQLRR